MYRKGCPDEYPITLILNGYEIAVFQITKHDLEDWAYGYLFSEGFIQEAREIESITINEEMGSINVSLLNGFNEEELFTKKKHYTAGCGRGVTFFSMTDVKNFQKVASEHSYKLSYLLKKQSEFARNSPFYLETGGMHGACIVDEAAGNITVREDIGRHNERLVLLTTGRVSYEMLSKAAKFGFPVIGSRTAATKQAVQLAKFLNIEVIGYLRGKMANIYTSTGTVENDLVEIPAVELH
jgi:FdhD protein